MTKRNEKNKTQILFTVNDTNSAVEQISNKKEKINFKLTSPLCKERQMRSAINCPTFATNFSLKEYKSLLFGC